MLEVVSNLITLIFCKVLYMSIVGSILGILILSVTKLFDSKLTAKWKCIIWIVPLIFLMIPINRIQISAQNNSQIFEIVDRVENSLGIESIIDDNNSNKTNANSNSDLNKMNTSNDLIKTDINSDNYHIQSSTKNVFNIIVYTIIPIIWLIGMAISIIIIIIGNINLNYKIYNAKKLDNSKIESILWRCKKRLKITKKIEIRLQSFNTSPCIYGTIKPKILVSKEFIKNNSEVIENVFMHELSHYKRKDMITNNILLIMTSVHWFNPLIYILFKKIRQEMELATDEIALSRMNKEEKKQYGLTLISLLQTYETEKVATKMLCIIDDNKNMKQRIEKIKLSIKLKQYKTSIIVLIVMIVLFMVSPFIIKVNADTIAKEERLYQIIEQYKFMIKDDEIIDDQITENDKNNIEYKEEILSEKIKEEMEKADELVNIEKTENEVKEHYSYINQNNSQTTNTNYIDINLFIGRWKPYKAEQNGDEIPLNSIYGSGISYGGELILNPDGTYTEFIGIYSSDVLDDLQGKYGINNSQRVQLTTNNGKIKILELIESSKVDNNEDTLVLRSEDEINIYFKK